LILAFLIIFGSIIVVLSEKQIEGKEDLTESNYQKQAQQLANSTAQEGIRLLKAYVDAPRPTQQNPNIPMPTYPAINRTTGNSTVKMELFDNIYKGNSLPIGTYCILANVETAGPDGKTYKASTEAMYSYYSTSNPPYYDISELFTDTTARYFVIFERTQIKVFRATANFYSIPTLMSSTSNHAIVDEIPMSRLADYNNTIYINKALSWAVTVGCAAQIDTTPETAVPGAYFTIDYKATIILNTSSPTRIGSHLFSTDPDRITIQSTSIITTNHIQDVTSNAYFYSKTKIAPPQTYAQTPNSGTTAYSDWNNGYPRNTATDTSTGYRPVGNDTITGGTLENGNGYYGRHGLSQVPIISAAGIFEDQVVLPAGEIPFQPPVHTDTMRSWAESTL